MKNENGQSKNTKKMRSPPSRTQSSESIGRQAGSTKVALWAVLLFAVSMSMFAIWQSGAGDLKLSQAVHNNADEISQLPSISHLTKESRALAKQKELEEQQQRQAQQEQQQLESQSQNVDVQSNPVTLEGAETATQPDTAVTTEQSQIEPNASAATPTDAAITSSAATANTQTVVAGSPPKPTKEFPRLKYDNYPSTLDPATLTEIGLLSKKPSSFFTDLHNKVDNVNPQERCNKYGYGTSVLETPRKIFYGSLIADEPWELMEIVAAEAYGIFDTVVFVEGNITQAHKKRQWKKNKPQDTENLKALFGTDNVLVKEWINEDHLSEFAREQGLRQAILEGWGEMGMTVDDIGYIADTDETFSREFLRVAQTCEGVDAFNYTKHQCVMQRIGAKTQMFESTPECINKYRVWRHPAMVPGHCLEHVADSNYHYLPQRGDTLKRPWGYGGSCDYSLVNRSIHGYPLFNGADFRNLCCSGPHTSTGKRWTTGFHFHNFFANINNTRFKYTSYGHHFESAAVLPLEMLSNDMKMTYRCIKNMTADPAGQKWVHLEGGFDRLPTMAGNPIPIYFQDEEYRKLKHEIMVEKIREDDLINNPANKTKYQTMMIQKELDRLERNRKRQEEIKQEKAEAQRKAKEAKENATATK